MAKIIYEHTPPAGSEVTRLSLALQCELCKGITWVYADQAWTKCARCAVRISNNAGTWREDISEECG